MSLVWRRFLALLCVLGAIAILAIATTTDSDSRKAVDSSQKLPDPFVKITYGRGKLTAADYVQIRRQLAKLRLRHSVIGIKVFGPGSIEVWTGPKENPGPLAGGGELITLKKVGSTWVVTHSDYWVG